ncbi:polyisoprenoid-binding protein YceI [Chitinophaga skermanii]|uniref:Polyisoprenoid-binding protein YceI n=1 Tax=Chitinophaga skermanii TaxID=331697 RepID=A0A327R2W8_9BACT|nr:YceI family protein [Chitinophaga skermanii]RAJ10575.1 polyisoprenoid-binding protein YceI [Chitinophaga skermanii]
MTIKVIISIFLSATLFMSCAQAPTADKAVVQDADSISVNDVGDVYKLDTASSVLTWIGTKSTGGHSGEFDITSGNIYVQDSTITGGQFIINVGSLKNVDLAKDADMRSQLETELRGPNFFDVAKFPSAKFDIISVQPYKSEPGADTILLQNATHIVKGNLTIKNVTKSMSFPVRITLTADAVLAQANFNMDRTLWGMTYRADKSLQDKLINSQVNITFSITAKAQQ